MRIELAQPELVVEVYDVDLPITALDRDVIEACRLLAPVSATRRQDSPPFVLSREMADVEVIAEAMALGRRAEQSAKAFVLTPESQAMSEPELARKFGVDRQTIRRWRGKG